MSRRLSHADVRLTLFVLAALALTLHSAFGQQSRSWPQFLGPDRNGISSETGLLDHWPTDGPKEIWRVSGGVGMSGLAVSDGRLVTLVQRDGEQLVVAHRAGNGQPLWQTAIAPAYKNQMGNGPRGAPTIVGDRVFVFSGEGVLAALELDGGKIIWSHNVVKELGGKVADYGMACSGTRRTSGSYRLKASGRGKANSV